MRAGEAMEQALRDCCRFVFLFFSFVCLIYLFNSIQCIGAFVLEKF